MRGVAVFTKSNITTNKLFKGPHVDIYMYKHPEGTFYYWANMEKSFNDSANLGYLVCVPLHINSNVAGNRVIKG